MSARRACSIHPARAQSARTQLALAVAAAVCLLLTAGCEPWGKPKEEPPPPEQRMDFATLYNENCVACHGVDGKNGPGRPLNNALYLSLIPKETLRETIANGRPGTAMPPWEVSQGGPLTDKQIGVLVDGIERNWAKPVNANSAAPSYSAGNTTGDPANGKKLFTRDCFMCHGPGAPVGPVTDPSYLSLSSDQMIRTSILVGRPDLKPLPMPDYRSLNLGHALSNQDVTDLVAYLSSLRPVPVAENAQVNESGTGQGGATARGSEGSGYGPGSPNQRGRGEGPKVRGSSQGGGGGTK